MIEINCIYSTVVTIKTYCSCDLQQENSGRLLIDPILAALQEVTHHMNEPVLINIGLVRWSLHELPPVGVARGGVRGISIAQLLEVVQECWKLCIQMHITIIIIIIIIFTMMMIIIINMIMIVGSTTLQQAT